MTRTRALFLIVLATTTFVHGPAIRTGYAYDDVEAILENPDLRNWNRGASLFQTNYWGERNIGLYRPLVQLSYLVDGAGFGFDPRFSHAFTLGLHLLVTGLLFGFLIRLGLPVGIVATATALFGVSPAVLGASVWISGRTDVLSALFTLLGLRLAFSAAEAGEGLFGRRTLGLGAMFFCGLLSKEMAITLPLLVLLLPQGGHARRLPVLGIAFLAYLALRVHAVSGVLPSYAGEGAGVVLVDRHVVHRLAIGVRACFRLLLLLVIPVGLAADHRAHPWAAGDVEVGATGFLALVVLGLWLFEALRRRRGMRPEVFLWCAVPVSLLPILQIIPIGAVMAERFNYTPAMFLLPAVVLLAHRGLSRWGGRISVTAAVMAILGSAVVTVERIPVYKDRESYCRDVVRAYPKDYRAWNNLGVYWFLPDPQLDTHAPDFDRADAAFAKSLQHRSGYRKGLLNRSRAMLERQRLVDEESDLTVIEGWLQRLGQSEDPDALYLLGKVALRIGRRSSDSEERKDHLELAWDRYRLAAEGFIARGAHPSRSAAAWKEAGLAAGDLKDEQRQREAWIHALDLHPTIGGASTMRKILRR